jgi:hypothetical protein
MYLQCGFHLGNHLDGAVMTHGRFVGVGLFVMRREVLVCDVCAEVEYGVERVFRVFGESFALGQRLYVEPFVEQEVEVAARENVGHARAPIGVNIRWTVRRRLEGTPPVM